MMRFSLIRRNVYVRILLCMSVLVIINQMTYLNSIKDYVRKNVLFDGLNIGELRTITYDAKGNVTDVKGNVRDGKGNVTESKGNVTDAPVLKPLAITKKNTKSSINRSPLQFNPDLFFKPPYHPLVYGTARHSRGYLTIGIPSVKRSNTERIYLYETLDYLVKKIPEHEEQQITIVILLADFNKTYNDEVSAHIYNKYRTFCDSGMIHILYTVDGIYPDLNNVKKTYNDPEPRLKWRAKQNIDFAYMMLYSSNLSDYYMQVEDDVAVATDFIHDIRFFVKTYTKKWFVLDFSRLGFIGRFFRSSDLHFIAMHLIENYDVAPCDILLGKLKTRMGQPRRINSMKSLFQHLGRFSSLNNKLQPLMDPHFKDASKINLSIDFPIGDNPPARIQTSLLPYNKSRPENVYDNKISTHFMCRYSKLGDYFTLTFEKPHNFSRIIIFTGYFETRRNEFKFVTLMYSTANTTVGTAQYMHDGTSCNGEFHKLVDFSQGDIDTLATGTALPDNITCLKLKVTKTTAGILVLRNIQLILRK